MTVQWKMAYELADAMCNEIGNGEACYGNVLIDAEPARLGDEFHFESPGDKVRLSELSTMRLSPLNSETGAWGISLLYVDAVTATESSPETVQLVFFGDVEIENNITVDPPEPVLVQTRALDRVNIRDTPSTDGEILGVLSFDDVVIANGRDETGDWLQIIIPDSSDAGWVFASLMSTEDAVDTLLVKDPNSPAYNPMQSFTYRSQARTIALVGRHQIVGF